MKKLLITFNFILLLTTLVFGQNIQTLKNVNTLEDFNFSAPSEIQSELPKWAQEMYSNPDAISTIKELYDEYYETNTFVKNQHTQYFKRLARTHSRINYDFNASAEVLEKREIAYVNRRDAAQVKSTGQWTAIGPTDIDLGAAVSGNTPGSAHVNTLSFCLGNETNILAGTATAGVWKSTDNGLNWTSTTHDYPIRNVYAVAFKPYNPIEMYCQGANTFYKSINGGTSWYETGGSALPLNFLAYEILTNYNIHNEIYLATNKGFFKSSDNGETFTKNLSGIVTEIEIHPTNHQIIYAVVASGNNTDFFRSEDGGDTFTKYDNGYPQPSSVEEQKRTVLAVSIDEPDAVYALAVGKMNGGDGLVGVYKSTNMGSNWVRRCCGDSEGGPASSSNPNIMEWNCAGTQNGGQYYYDLAIAANPNNIDEIITGGINLWSSNDGGNSMQCLSDYVYSNMTQTYVHADIHDIKYINGAIWVASDGGIFRSTDNAQSFIKRMNGLHGTDFRGFDVSFYNQHVMVGGTYHNGTMLKECDNFVNGWASTRSGDNQRSYVNDGNSSVIYDHSGKRTLSGDRFISPKNENLLRKPNSSLIYGESSEIVFHPFDYSTFYLGQGSRLYRTTDDGVTFEEVENFGTGLVTSIEISPINPELIYVVHYPSYGAEKKIKRSLNGGISWVDVTIPTSLYNNENTWVTFDIAVGTSSPMNIWAIRTTPTTAGVNLDGNSVFFSSDAGATWQNITSSDLDGEYPTNIAHHHGTNDVIYIGTRRSVYSKDGSNWNMLANNLPLYTFSTKLVPHYTSGKLLNATQRGLFEMDLPMTGGMAVPMVSQTFSDCLRDTFYFMDRSPVNDSYTRTWTFTGADQPTSNEIFPKVTYSTPGIYPVKLEIFGSNGNFVYESLDFIEVQDGCSIEPIVGNSLTTGNSAYAKVTPFDKEYSEITITAWVKRNGPIFNNGGVVTHRDGTDGTGMFINSQGFLVGQWDELNSSANSTLSVPFNRWAHIAMTVAPDGITLYVDGQSQFFSRSISAVDFNSFFHIGTDEFAVSNYFTGLIDEVKFYDVELSPEEIQQNMNLTSEANEANLFSYFQMNNNSGRITDRKGNSHAIIINNAARTGSLAPVSGGCAEIVDIYEAGTYDFPCSGVSLTFDPGDILPQGPVAISKLNEIPGLTLPPVDNVSNGYWVFNNFGANQGISAPKNVEISNIGNSNILAQPNNFDAYMVPNWWEFGWGASADSPDAFTVTDNGTVTFDQFEAMTYMGKLIIGESGATVLSAYEVELSAEYVDKYVEVKWDGISSYAAYELLKSDNGKDFHPIEDGTPNNTLFFHEDKDLTNTILYYKLRLFDENGEYSDTDVTTVSVPELDDVKIFPNVVATGSDFNVHIGERDMLKFRIYNLEGRLIKEVMQETTVSIHSADLQPGQYAIEFISNQDIETQFLFVQ